MAEEIVKLTLNNLPTDLDYEDFISAHLLLGGYTLDRSIHEKLDGAGEIFEVDIVTHKYKETDEKRLIEIKSKKWDINDIFKVGGRLRYLGVDNGVFIVQQKIDEKKFEYWQKSMQRMDVSLIYVGKKSSTDSKLDLTDFNDNFGIDASKIDENIIESIRFSYIAERCMRSRISQLNKSQQKEGVAALWDFSNAIQDISFYADDPIERLHRTFELFMEYNRISSRLDYEKVHGMFPSVDQISSFETGRVRKYLLNEEDYLPVNYAIYLEHRLRMYIIQSCVEYLVAPKEEQTGISNFLKRLSYNTLSSNILNGIKYLGERCPSCRLYPRFWQLFIHMMGGFILTDLYDEEIGMLCKLSGVPKDEIDNCFEVYDVLFHTDESWIRDINFTHIKRLNFMPAPFMGIGANFRRYYYSENKNEKDPPYEYLRNLVSGEYTYNNLQLWNKAAFDLLMSSSDVNKVKAEIK